MPRLRSTTRLLVFALVLLLSLSSSAFALPMAAQGTGDPHMAAGADLETDDASDVSSHEQFHDDSSQGGRNEVIVHNQSDGKLLMRGRVDLEHLPGRSVAPENYAEAVGSCVRCQTLAVALQIDLISRNATTIAPQNAAVALNLHCTGCFTSARALQYVIQVDDPTEVPERARDLVQTLMRHDLVDEYLLMIHPRVLGAGRRLFPEGTSLADLQLVDCQPTTRGVLLATYRPRRSGK